MIAGRSDEDRPINLTNRFFRGPSLRGSRYLRGCRPAYSGPAPLLLHASYTSDRCRNRHARSDRKSDLLSGETNIAFVSQHLRQRTRLRCRKQISPSMWQKFFFSFFRASPISTDSTFGLLQGTNKGRRSGTSGCQHSVELTSALSVCRVGLTGDRRAYVPSAIVILTLRMTVAGQCFRRE